MSGRVLVTIVTSACLGAGVLGGCAATPQPILAEKASVTARSPHPATTPTARAGPTPLRVWQAWNRARAKAYAQADAGALRALYRDGAGDRDVEVLKAYARRGLRVVDQQQQTHEFRVAHRSRATMTVVVTSRSFGAHAVTPDGRRVTLPGTRFRSRRVDLIRTSGGWRVERVESVAR